MKHVVNTLHSVAHTACVSYIANVELQLVGLKLLTHVVLLLLIAAENPNFPNIRTKETLHYRVTERTSSTGDE